MRHSLKLVSFKLSSANHNNNLCNVLNVSISVAPLREACGDYVYIDMQFMDWDHVNRFWNQQLHVQEFPSDARLRSRMEQCYSVISSMLTVNLTYSLVFQKDISACVYLYFLYAVIFSYTWSMCNMI